MVFTVADSLAVTQDAITHNPMKKSLPIILWALALVSPIAHMLAYHFWIEGWGKGYAMAMFWSALLFSVATGVGGVAAADKFWK